MESTTLLLEENNDGELFFELPDELIDALGWDDGTELEFTIVGDSIRISKVPDEFLGQPGVERAVSYLERGNYEMVCQDAEVVGDPSY